jgi:hypothetical protein
MRNLKLSDSCILPATRLTRTLTIHFVKILCWQDETIGKGEKIIVLDVDGANGMSKDAVISFDILEGGSLAWTL